MIRFLALKGISYLIRRQFPKVRSLSTSTLESWLNSSNSPLLLDARTLDEFNVSHLSNAKLIDPKNPDWSILTNYPKDAAIVVYCSVGYRSAKLVQQLQAQGFSNVWNLEGSIFRWANEARSLYNSEGQRTMGVHPYNAQWAKLLNPNYRYEQSTRINAPL